MNGRADELNEHGWRRLLAATAKRLSSNNLEVTGNVSIAAPDDDERYVLTLVTGKHKDPGVAKVTVPLRAVEASVRARSGHDLVTTLNALGYQIQDRRGTEAAEAETRARVETILHGSRYAEQPWFRTWMAQINGATLTRLVRSEQPTRTATWLVALLDRLPANDMPIPVLAEAATGDTKGLTGPLESLVLGAIAARAGLPPLTDAAGRRELWDSVGVLVDDVSSTVLVLNLAARPRHALVQAAGDADYLAASLTAAARGGFPRRVTLNELARSPVGVDTREVPEVWVCENPSVLQHALTRLGPACPPLICTEGQPSVAAWRLLRALHEDGVILHWRNDFDWPGLGMTDRAVREFAAQPWRMTAADYETALAIGDSEPLKGSERPAPWDPSLARALATSGRAVMEERIVDLLVADLTAAAGTAVPRLSECDCRNERPRRAARPAERSI